jgi:hypothetical protein
VIRRIFLLKFGVISRLAEKIETKARAELAHRLVPAENAPPKTVRMLARDKSIEVAGPILSLSNRLSYDEPCWRLPVTIARSGCSLFQSAPA